MNTRGAGPTRELHGIDLIDLFCRLNHSRVEPGFDRRRAFPGEKFRDAKAIIDNASLLIVRPLIPISWFYPGIKQKDAITWAAVGLMTFDNHQAIKDLFHSDPKFLLHTPEPNEWGSAAYLPRREGDPFAEPHQNSYWIFVVTPKLVTDPFTRLQEVPRINWLPEY